MTRHAGSENGIHPLPEDLLRFLDNELTAGHLASVRLHLTNCPKCRETVHRFSEVSMTFSGDAIASVLAEPDTSSAQTVPLPVNASVAAHLSEWGIGRPRTASGWRAAALGSLSRTAAAGVAVAVMGSLMVHFLLSPPRVSARNVVDIARRERRERQSNSPARTMERILRVTRKAGGLPASTEYWSSRIEPRTSRERLIAGTEEAEEIFARLPNASCRAFVPLSLEMLDCLLDEQRQSVTLEEIPRGDSIRGYQIALSAPALGRQSFRSHWTIERSDWQLRKVEFELGSKADSVRILIEEEAVRAYRPVPAESPKPALAGSPAISSHPAPAWGRVLTNVPGTAAIRNRLRAFEAIASFQPVPEEDLSVLDLPDGAVSVKGVVQGEDRRTNLREILRSAPDIAFAVRTQEEAVASAFAESARFGYGSPPQSVPHLEAAAGTNREMRGEGPMLIAALEEHFGNDKTGKANLLLFGEQVSDVAQDLAFHAGWLRRFEKAFSERDLAQMGEADLRRFFRLRNRWYQSVARRYERLQSIIRPVLCSSGCEVGGSGEETDALASAGRNSLSLYDALTVELGLVKTMFVDRAFLPMDSAGSAEARWAFANSAVAGAMKQYLVPNFSRAAAAAAAVQPSAAPGAPPQINNADLSAPVPR